MCVHTSHCCRYHGCKFGDVDCPVYLLEVIQEYPCERCGDEGRETLKDIPKIHTEEIKKRRDEATYMVCPYDEY